MSAIKPLLTDDGRIILRDLTYSPDEVLEAALRYREFAYAADEDRENGRQEHYDRFSAPARDEEGRNLEAVTTPTLTWQDALALIDDLATAAALARQQEQQADPVRFTNPMMRRA